MTTLEESLKLINQTVPSLTVDSNTAHIGRCILLAGCVIAAAIYVSTNTTPVKGYDL